MVCEIMLCRKASLILLLVQDEICSIVTSFLCMHSAVLSDFILWLEASLLTSLRVGVESGRESLADVSSYPGITSPSSSPSARWKMDNCHELLCMHAFLLPFSLIGSFLLLFLITVQNGSYRGTELKALHRQ